MVLQQRKAHIVQIGNLCRLFSGATTWPGYSSGITEEEFNSFVLLLETLVQHNGWFTPLNVRRALQAWGQALTEENVNKWLSSYEISHDASGKTIAIIAAGNIPMVGLHDVICALTAGHRVLLKPSSDDDLLLPALLAMVFQGIEPEKQPVQYARGKLHGFQAVLATGSNNTSRYFESYFRNVPHVVRKSRTSLAVLTGDETPQELEGLGHDIFDYFGLGCRNVSKILVPAGYDPDHFYRGIYSFHDVILHNKYANNYDYTKAVWLLNNESLLDNGFLLLKQDENLFAPTGSLFTWNYSDPESLSQHLDSQRDHVQCIVGRGYLPFGTAQYPMPWDYADGVDTMKFLLEV